MVSTLAPPVESSRRLRLQLREMISNRIDLLDASSKLGVTLSTLRKILAGGPISPFIRRKIGRALEGADGGSAGADTGGKKRSNIERLLEVSRLYQEYGTLRRVAEALGLSHERVRQLLVRGSEFGLFEYHPSAEVTVQRERILSDYRRLLTLKEVARANRISTPRLKGLLKAYRISDAQLKQIWINAKKAGCAGRYDAVVRKLGHHPTTTELQRNLSAHYLATQIRRFWGSMEAFRSDRGIPPPERRAADDRR
jgi:hypothetical protein